MFKGLGNLASLMKQAQQMQGRMKEIQDQLAKVRVRGMAGGGMVVVESNGQQQIVGCTIDESLLAGGDREMLEDLVIVATNQALEKAKAATQEAMSELAGGLNIPGVQDALSKLGMGPNSTE